MTQLGIFGTSRPRKGSAGLGITSAEQQAIDYPWKSYSSKTVELQKATNTSLREAGYCPIGEDGVLGPATCGARAQLTIDHAGTGPVWHLPVTCPADGSTYKLPKKASQGCSTATPSSPTVISPTPTSFQPTTSSMSMSSSTKRALAFMIGGLGAAAIVFVLKKRAKK